MSIYNGKKLKIEIYGESHAEKIGVSVKGFPRFKFDENGLNAFMARRKATDSVYSTSRKESDVPVFTGVKGGEINGEFTAEIFNTDKRSKDYSALYGKPRPSHADYAWYIKDGALWNGGVFAYKLSYVLYRIIYTLHSILSVLFF